MHIYKVTKCAFRNKIGHFGDHLGSFSISTHGKESTWSPSYMLIIISLCRGADFQGGHLYLFMSKALWGHLQKKGAGGKGMGDRLFETKLIGGGASILFSHKIEIC